MTGVADRSATTRAVACQTHQSDRSGTTTRCSSKESCYSIIKSYLHKPNCCSIRRIFFLSTEFFHPPAKYVRLVKHQPNFLLSRIISWKIFGWEVAWWRRFPEVTSTIPWHRFSYAIRSKFLSILHYPKVTQHFNIFLFSWISPSAVDFPKLLGFETLN